MNKNLLKTLTIKASSSNIPHQVRCTCDLFLTISVSLSFSGRLRSRKWSVAVASIVHEQSRQPARSSRARPVGIAGRLRARLSRAGRLNNNNSYYYFNRNINKNNFLKQKKLLLVLKKIYFIYRKKYFSNLIEFMCLFCGSKVYLAFFKCVS